jgi:hypothetical protein
MAHVLSLAAMQVLQAPPIGAEEGVAQREVAHWLSQTLAPHRQVLTMLVVDPVGWFAWQHAMQPPLAPTQA